MLVQMCYLGWWSKSKPSSTTCRPSMMRLLNNFQRPRWTLSILTSNLTWPGKTASYSNYFDDIPKAEEKQASRALCGLHQAWCQHELLVDAGQESCFNSPQSIVQHSLHTSGTWSFHPVAHRMRQVLLRPRPKPKQRPRQKNLSLKKLVLKGAQREPSRSAVVTICRGILL